MGKSRRSMSWRSSGKGSSPGSVTRRAPAYPTVSSRRGLLGAGLVQVATQVADLVAQLGGVLEAQLVRGGQHLLLELHQQLLDLLGGHLGIALLAPASALGDLRLALHELRDVGDALDDRLGRDTVLDVVG